MADKYVVTVAAEQAGIPPLQSERVQEISAQFSVNVLLPFLTSLSVTVANENPLNTELQKWAVTSFLKPQWQASIKEYIEKVDQEQGNENPEFTFLNQRQLNSAIAHVCSSANSTGTKTLESAEDRFLLGEILLSLNSEARDLTPSKNPEDLTWLEIAQEIDRNASLYSSDLPARFYVGAHLTCQPFNPAQEQRFLEFVGCTSFELFTALFAVHSWISTMNFARFQHSWQFGIDLPFMFGKCRISKRVGNALSSHFVLDLNESSISLESADQVRSALFSKPLIRWRNNQLYCGDFVSSERAVTRGIFQVTQKVEHGCVAENLFVPKSVRFAELCESLLSCCAKNSKYQTARFVPGIENQNIEFDSAFVEFSNVVLFEFKSGFVSTAVRTSGTPSDLESELRKKWINGDAKQKKGIAQLQEKAKAILSDPAHVGMDRIGSIWPVLVVEDEFVASKMIGQFISDVVVNEFQFDNIQLKSPIVISVYELFHFAIRSQDWSVLDFVLRLSKGMKDYIATKNLILNEFPLGGNRLPAILPEAQSLLESAHADIIANFQRIELHSCEKCGKECETVTKNGVRHWRCGACNKTRVISKVEQEALDKDYREAVGWYESS